MSDHALVLENVCVTRAGFDLLTDVCMAVPRGRCHAVLGPNGAGKSALVSVCAGFMWPSFGVVRINGQTLGKTHLSPLRETLGLIEPSRSPEFPEWMTTYDVIATGLFGSVMLPLGLELSGNQCRRIDQEIEVFSLGHLQDASFGRLSSGEQMKTLLARALVGCPTLLLLDEPTAGLDMGARAACVAVLDTLLERPEAPSMLVVSHHVDELPMAVEQVHLLKRGRMVRQGPTSEMLTGGHLSELFDCDVRVSCHGGRYMAHAVSARW